MARQREWLFRRIRRSPLLISVISVFFLIAAGPWARGLDKEVKALVDFETLKNGAALRSNLPIALEHYEIPIELLYADIAQRIPEDLLNALVIRKGSKSYVRWIKNPEDKTYFRAVENFLLSKGVSIERHSYFIGYQTASRSYIVEDPIGGAQFSVKVSTDTAGGESQDKRQDVTDAKKVRLLTDYVYAINQENPFKHIILMDEPAMFALPEIDQAMLIRTLGGLEKSGNYYVPFFTQLHETAGAEIARQNGSSNPARFVNKHGNEDLGTALGEYAAATGVTYQSPHSQQFLGEYNYRMRPTGRIVLRDPGDSFLFRSFFEKTGQTGLLKQWVPDYIKPNLHVSIGLLRGTPPPSWLDSFTPSIVPNNYRDYFSTFMHAFESEYSADTGIPLSELNGRRAARTPLNMYGLTYEALDTPAWRAYFKGVTQRRSFKSGFMQCQKALRQVGH